MECESYTYKKKTLDSLKCNPENLQSVTLKLFS